MIDDQSKANYVKKIIKINPAIIPNEDILVAIFNEIRDVQAGKKNISVVEGVTIEAPDEALNHGRYLTTTEIRLLVLNRVLNQTVIGSRIPTSFFDIYIQFPEEKEKTCWKTVNLIYRGLCLILIVRKTFGNYLRIYIIQLLKIQKIISMNYIEN